MRFATQSARETGERNDPSFAPLGLNVDRRLFPTAYAVGYMSNARFAGCKQKRHDMWAKMSASAGAYARP